MAVYARTISLKLEKENPFVMPICSHIKVDIIVNDQKTIAQRQTSGISNMDWQSKFY